MIVTFSGIVISSLITISLFTFIFDLPASIAALSSSSVAAETDTVTPNASKPFLSRITPSASSTVSCESKRSVTFEPLVATSAACATVV